MLTIHIIFQIIVLIQILHVFYDKSLQLHARIQKIKEGSYCIHIDNYTCILVFLYKMKVIFRIISLQNYQIKKLPLSNNASERMYRDYMHLYCNLYL